MNAKLKDLCKKYDIDPAGKSISEINGLIKEAKDAEAKEAEAKKVDAKPTPPPVPPASSVVSVPDGPHTTNITVNVSPFISDAALQKSTEGVDKAYATTLFVAALAAAFSLGITASTAVPQLMARMF